jgi:hypothetical protein
MAPIPPLRRHGFQFRAEELDDFLDLVESFLPISAQNWQAVADVHLENYHREARTAESLRRKFQEISCRTGSLVMARLTVLAEIALVLTSHTPGTSLAAARCSDSCYCTAWFVHALRLCTG